MSDKTQTIEDLQAEEATATPAPSQNEAKVEKPDTSSEKVAEQTISDLVPSEKPAEQNTIPEGVFLGEKKARKAAEKEVKRLKALIEEGGTKAEISDSIEAIADEHDIDKKFLKKLTSTIKAQAKAEIEAELKAKDLTKEKAQKFEKAFSQAFDTALERAPEFESVANAGVIKQLALLPQNAKKTVSQLLEETYGNAISGKRTIETQVSPGGGKEPAPLDINRARNDLSYYKEIMSNPKLKAQYNEQMIKRGF